MQTNSKSGWACAMDWLVGKWQWPAACLYAACVLLLLTPAWFHFAGLALTLVYLQLPIYMIHEWEEHTGDRFRKYVNQVIAGGYEALTPTFAFWVNAIGVWGVSLASLYLACFVNLSFGLIAIYLPVVNAIIHVAQAVARREYNPGLWTSLALFLPIGGWSLYVVSAQSGATWLDQVASAGFIVAVHLGLVVHMARRVMRLRGTARLVGQH